MVSGFMDLCWNNRVASASSDYTSEGVRYTDNIFYWYWIYYWTSKCLCNNW